MGQQILFLLQVERGTKWIWFSIFSDLKYEEPINIVANWRRALGGKGFIASSDVVVVVVVVVQEALH